MDVEQLMSLTEEYGASWATKHSERLLKWIGILAEGRPYDEETVLIAAYLHDWGAYPRWVVEGMDHAVRSAEVAEGFLAEQGISGKLADRVIECIRYHHGGPDNRSLESVLFTDADALDLLGTAGVLRVFSMCPRNLGAACEAVRRWKETSNNAIMTPKARAIARQRSTEMDMIMERFVEETFGIF